MNKLGVIMKIGADCDIAQEMKKAKDIGCECCQLNVWDTSMYTDACAKKILAASKKYELEISTVWAGWSGPKEWNFTAGPETLGIVPEAYRMKRTEEILMGVEFAAKLGCTRVATHAGFLPENMNDPQYCGVLAALRHIVKYCRKLGVNFLFETGQ